MGQGRQGWSRWQRGRPALWLTWLLAGRRLIHMTTGHAISSEPREWLVRLPGGRAERVWAVRWVQARDEAERLTGLPRDLLDPIPLEQIRAA